jgi:hypothetical protein
MFHESYGEVSRAALALIKKHNLSPSDWDTLNERGIVRAPALRKFCQESIDRRGYVAVLPEWMQ